MLVDNLLLSDFGVNGATFTLQVELMAVPFILLAAAVSRSTGFLGLLVVALASVLITDNPVPIGGQFAIKSTLVDFMLGMVVAAPEIRQVVSRLPKGAWIVFLVMLLLVRHVVAHSSVSGELSQAVLAACVIGCLYHQDTAGSLLGGRTMLVFGRVSYSLYLFNVGVMNLLIPPMYWWLGPTRVQAVPVLYGLLLGLATAVCTMPIALASERFIERPFIAFGRRYLGERARPETRRSVADFLRRPRLGSDTAARDARDAETAPQAPTGVEPVRIGTAT
jgi:peptidoglycan/LPS O-acetylase OafA/YrhL